MTERGPLDFGFDPSRAGCGGYLSPAVGGAMGDACQAEAVAAGLVLEDGRTALVSLGPVHAPLLIAGRPLLDRDRSELERRRRWIADGHAVRAGLAAGVAAQQLVTRARNWARRNPDRLYPSIR